MAASKALRWPGASVPFKNPPSVITQGSLKVAQLFTRSPSARATTSA